MRVRVELTRRVSAVLTVCKEAICASAKKTIANLLTLLISMSMYFLQTKLLKSQEKDAVADSRRIDAAR